jgi:hypothetical protein
VHRQRAYVGGGLQPGAALVVVCLAVVTLPPRSAAPMVAGCRLVGCSVVSGSLADGLYAVALWRGCRCTSASAWGPFWPPMPRPCLLLPRPPGEGGVGFT